MKKRAIFAAIVAIMLCSGYSSYSQNSEYKATPVTISKDKVRNNGKLYFSHVVLERQTLFSISKVYNVSIQDIYDSNPTLNLEKEGLKTYQILLIPIADGIEETAVAVKPDNGTALREPVKEQTVQMQPVLQEQVKQEEYIIHTVKWFEDLDGIAKKYGVSKESIMKANGLSSSSVTRKMKLRIPLNAEAEDSVTASDGTSDKNMFEEIGAAIAEKAEEFLFPKQENITAALILPFNAQKQPNDNNLEFYSGVLMAMRDLSNEGINAELDVYDAAGGIIPITKESLTECDVVLGPISTADITSTLKISEGNVPVVSPLEPKAANLTALHSNLIQAPSSSSAQCEDIIQWLKEEFRQGDRILLFSEKGKAATSTVTELVNALTNSGLQYTSITYGLLEGKNIADNIEGASSPDHTTRIVVASESEAFVSDVVRNANLVAHRKFNIALYCTSKVRSFDTIEVENLHNTNLHTSISYYVDYDSPEVRKFILAYRALFNAEPGPFAFQGYDTAHYFCMMSSMYGKHWPAKLVENPGKGLQSDFKFIRTDGGGYLNTAVRRVLYMPDFRIANFSGKQ